MADFNFYLNRQGIQGRKGDKGDTGFTPTISVSEQTLDSYKLKITNEYNEFETPNLIGNLGVTDNGGTYLRYDPITGTVSTGEIDGATAEVVGGVRKSTDADLTNLSADTAVTPANVADILPLLLEAGTDNVTITQDEATSKTKISVEDGGSGDVTAAGDNTLTGSNTFTNAIKTPGMYSIEFDDRTYKAQLTDGTQVIKGEDNISHFQNYNTRLFADDGSAYVIPVEDVIINASGNIILNANNNIIPDSVYGTFPTIKDGHGNIMLSQGNVTAGDNVTIGYTVDGIEISSSGGSGDVTAAGDNRFTGDNTFTGKVNIAGGALTVDGLANLNQATAQDLNAVSITSSGEVNAVSIKTNGLRSDDIQTTENKKYLTELDVDNHTIQVINGKLHANLDKLGNDVNSLTGDVTSLTGDVTRLTGDVDSLTGVITNLTGRVTTNEADISAMKTGKQNKLTAGANVTLTDLSDGTVRIDSTGGGGGSAPTNVVTTDTAQDITANKTFYGEIRVAADYNYATLAKFSKEALVSGNSTLLEHIDLGEAVFVVKGDLGKKVYDTDKYVYKKYINVDDLSDDQIMMDNSISSQVAHMAMPSDEYIDLTLGASGTTYTAPADGWVMVRLRATAVGQYIQLVNQSSALQSWVTAGAAGLLACFIPVGANDRYAISYTCPLGGADEIKRFIYAVGAKPVIY